MNSQLAVTDAMTTAQALLASGYLPNTIKTSQQAFAIITLGHELGLGAWASLNGINVIQGKPTVSPQTMLALINRSGFLEDMHVEEGEDYSACTMKRRGRTPYTFTFSDADAQAMGLLSKDNWRKMRATMRRWRAINGCVRIVFPDVINGMYPPEEIAPDMDVNEDGALLTVPDAPKQIEAFIEQRALPSGCWSKEEATAWVKKWYGIAKLKSADLLGILGIEAYSQWCDGEDQADALVNDWLSSELNGQAEAEQA